LKASRTWLDGPFILNRTVRIGRLRGTLAELLAIGARENRISLVIEYPLRAVACNKYIHTSYNNTSLTGNH